MKPDAAETSVFLAEVDKDVNELRDEAVGGEFGLVINGHSLVQIHCLLMSLTVKGHGILF